MSSAKPKKANSNNARHTTIHRGDNSQNKGQHIIDSFWRIKNTIHRRFGKKYICNKRLKISDLLNGSDANISCPLFIIKFHGRFNSSPLHFHLFHYWYVFDTEQPFTEKVSERMRFHHRCSRGGSVCR